MKIRLDYEGANGFSVRLEVDGGAKDGIPYMELFATTGHVPTKDSHQLRDSILEKVAGDSVPWTLHRGYPQGDMREEADTYAHRFRWTSPKSKRTRYDDISTGQTTFWRLVRLDPGLW